MLFLKKRTLLLALLCKLSEVKVLCSYLKTKDLKAWHLGYTHKEGNEIYAIAAQTEAIRCNTVSHYSLLLHQYKMKERVIGESKADFQLFPNDWRQFIDDTIIRAKLVENPAYLLPEKWEIPSARNPIYDETFDHDTSKELARINETLINLDADILHGCSLASHEAFLEKYMTKIENSYGLSLRLPSTKVLWDFVLMSKNKEVEINCFLKRRFTKDFNWVKILQEEARQLVDLQNAELPPTGEFSVVMADEALDTIFDYFTAQSDGSALYHKYSCFEKGGSIYDGQKNALEPLTIKTDPSLVGGMNSGFFEPLGYPLTPLTIIKDGHLENFTISGKFSYLLDKPRTSALSNIVVKSGITPYQDFLESGVFELLRFSTFHPNPITGSFSGEIRLGYWHKGGKKIPIKGGSVSGVSQKDFLRARFSLENLQREAYRGPKGIFFEKMTLAGK